MKKTRYSMCSLGGAPGARKRWIMAVGSLLLLGPLLVACTTPPDPLVAHDALSEVTADPAAHHVDAKYSAEEHPEPIVEPLSCTPYLVITARGTGEPHKKQLLAPVVKAIKKAYPEAVEYVDLDYPADTDVKEGGTLGARTLIDTLNVQSVACPEQGFILLGYSQGALIIGDALAGPDARLVGPTVGEVSDFASTRILAVVFYGNPRFVGGEAYDYGSFNDAMNGLLPRPPGSLDRYLLRLRDFCVDGDFICQSSLELDDMGHIEYYSNGMQQDGAAFVLTRLRLSAGEAVQEVESDIAELDADRQAAVGEDAGESETDEPPSP